MSRGKSSGYTLTNSDAKIVMGMIGRGDRHHDIAAWFGVNQGRIAEVQDGKFGAVSAAPEAELPPKGAPGVKGKRLRSSIARSLSKLENDEVGIEDFVDQVRQAIKKYDSYES